MTAGAARCPPPTCDRGTTMAIIDFIKKQFIDIIEWTDDSRDTLSYPLPRRGQGDQERRAADRARVAGGAVRLPGRVRRHVRPGKHTLTTDNIPVLTNLKSWKYALESPFKADVYYVVTRAFTGNKWGTANPVMMRDADFGDRAPARLRHVRLPHRRREEVPEGSRRHRRSLPARRVQRHDALADRQRVLRGAGQGSRSRRSTSRRAIPSWARRCCR